MIRVIAGGKKSKDWVFSGQIEYEKRLKKPFDTKIEYFDDEKMANLAKNWAFKPSEYVILLDERGEILSSVDFSKKLERIFLGSKSLVLIIGGPYGVTPELRAKANLVLSFSKMVFPHELMRVMLFEQIYRAQEISRGGKYHHL